MKRLMPIIFSLFVFQAACEERPGVPTELISACAAENDRKVLEVTGFLEPRRFMYCSNRGGRMECGFDLKEAPGSDKILRIDIEQGSSANMAEKLESRFTKEDVKIFDNKGTLTDLNLKMKVTGRMTISPPSQGNEGVCFMQVTKIEQ